MIAHQNRDRWYFQHKALSSLIKSWGLIPGCPSHEFDGLSFKLLSALYRDKSNEQITRILESEFTAIFGCYSQELDLDTWTADVVSWWAEQ